MFIMLKMAGLQKCKLYDFGLNESKAICDAARILCYSIKTIGSELQGQEQAACMHVLRPT